MSDLDLATVDRLLTTTRSVRKRLDFERPVPQDILRQCLEIAMQAPTGSNAQGWHWIVVTDAQKKAALADLYRRAATGYIKRDERPPERMPDDPHAWQMRRVLDSSAYLMERLHEVPVHVIPCLTRRGPQLALTSGASIYPAVWSFQLALRARGLGSCITTLHLRHADEAASLLGLPENVVQCALLPVAWYTGKTFRPADRRDTARVIHWERW
jgi:nitroreductase